jgi:hypothetical protein
MRADANGTAIHSRNNALQLEWTPANGQISLVMMGLIENG